MKKIKKNTDQGIMRVAMQQAFTHTEIELSPRRDKLRSSALPYCPLAEWYNLATNPNARPVNVDGQLFEVREYDLAGRLYMEMGNTVHEILQNWIVKSQDKIRVLAKWDNKGLESCVGKGCPIVAGKTIELNNKGCSKCGAFPTHEEITVDGKSTGAIDQTWVLAMGMDVQIVDIKTTSLGKVYNHNASLKDPGKTKKGKPKKRPESPYPNAPYIWQTDAYAVRFFKRLKKMGYRLKGTTILYIPRDNPSQYVFVPIRERIKKSWILKMESRLDRVSDGWVVVTEALKLGDISNIVDEVKALKLCASYREYEKDVEPCWECPLAEVCFDEKKLDKKLKSASKLYATNREAKPVTEKPKKAHTPVKMRKWESSITL